MSSLPITPRRAQFTAGRDLIPGTNYRIIANGKGEVIETDTFLLATTTVDKKGNRHMVNTATGEVLAATPSSIWTQ